MGIYVGNKRYAPYIGDKRRRYMGGGIILPDGYLKDKGLTPTKSNDNIINADGFCVTAYLRLSAYTRKITFDCGWLGADYSYAYSAIKVYNSNNAVYDLWGGTTRPRTVNLTQNTWGIRATFFIKNLNQCYIYDETNQKYLFRYGKIVE